MKTKNTIKKAFELLKKASIEFNRQNYFHEKENLREEINSFLSKDDNEYEIYSDCKNFVKNIELSREKNNLPDFKFTPPAPENYNEESECPMNNLINRLITSYPLVSEKLDTNIDLGNKIPNIFKQYQYAFNNYDNIHMDTWKNKNDTYYYILEHKGNVYESTENFEFEMTAQMACIEKAFDVCNKNIFDVMPRTSNTINKSTKTINLLEKFEDWYAEKEYAHLMAGTEFKPKEMFDFFKPYINFNGC